MFCYYNGIEIVLEKEWQVSGDAGKVRLINATAVRTGHKLYGIPLNKVKISPIHTI